MTRRRVSLVLGTSTGGVGAHVSALVGGLLAEDWSVAVCGPRSTDELFDFTRLGASFRPVQISGHSGLPTAVVQLRRITGGSDLVHAHGLRAGLAAVAAGRRPLVVTWHNAVLPDSGPKQAALSVGERVVARGASITLAASHDLEARARELGGRDVRFCPIGVPILPPERSRTVVRDELGVAG